MCSAFAAAFLISEKDFDLKSALKLIKQKCKGAGPNQGFALQLEQFYLIQKAQKLKKAKQVEIQNSSNRLMMGQSNQLAGVVVQPKAEPV